MVNIKTSTFLNVNLYDAGKAALTAAILAVVVTCGQVLQTWLKSPDLHIDRVDLILTLKVGIGAFASELVRRFLSANKATLTNLNKETIDAIKAGGTVIVKNPDSGSNVAVVKNTESDK